MFDKDGEVVTERADSNLRIADKLLRFRGSHSTDYSKGLSLADEVLERATESDDEQKPPIVIFLSDGGNQPATESDNPIEFINNMREMSPGLVLHTILFGSDSRHEPLLREMADAGGGEFQRTMDDVQLAKTFSELAQSLRPNIVSP